MVDCPRNCTCPEYIFQQIDMTNWKLVASGNLTLEGQKMVITTPLEMRSWKMCHLLENKRIYSIAEVRQSPIQILVNTNQFSQTIRC